jgi:hypothetical protein
MCLEKAAMLDYANADLNNLREALLDHPLYDNVAFLADLKLFMEDHVFASITATAAARRVGGSTARPISL